MKNIIFILAMSLVGFGSFASEKPTKEMREKMAAFHEKMATCLRSDKDVKECHKEMRKECKESMGKDGCHMMGKMGKGMMHHHDDDDAPKK